MPELPEVETVRRSLEPALFEGSIVAVETSTLALRRRAIPRELLRRALTGARFTATRRHGKYLMLDTSAGATVLVHLGMAGRLLLVDGAAPAAPHTHVTVRLSSGRALAYVDPRRFGIVRLYPTPALWTTEELADLGPDPLDEAFVEGGFAAALGRTRRDLKAALMDQRLVAGLGNIYVSEALFAAGLSPRRRAHRTRPGERAALYAAIREVLRRGVQNRGTSFSDYVDADGRKGDNQRALAVYGREGEPCRRCGAVVRRLVQAGRATYFCPRCQASTGTASGTRRVGR